MTASSFELTRRYFNVEEANARLPLVRVIIKDIVDLSHSLRERHDRLFAEFEASGEAGEIDITPLEEDRDRLENFVEELHKLGAELKDYFTGLVDFPGWVEDREVCLCWKLGEGNIEFWHETDTGFRGRKKINGEFRLKCSQPRE